MKPKSKIHRFTLILMALLSIVVLTNAQEDEGALPDTTPVTLMLDWTPNTNHMGFYIAEAKGYYDDLNLDVTIIEPADVSVEQALDSGIVEFGIGFQEFSTFALASGVDVVSIAAIIQNNTSGFATIAADHPITMPEDLTPLTYGGFGLTDLENAIITRLLECGGETWNTGQYQDIGFADPIELLELKRIDFAWIFYGWQGIRAEAQGTELDVIMLSDYPDCVPNYYTPILLTSREMINEQPEVVRAFVHATSQGYEYAIANPQETAKIFHDLVPELDEVLVNESTAWLSTRYQGTAPRWGEQSLDVWQDFTTFLLENGIITEEIDVETVYTNEFLPDAKE